MWLWTFVNKVAGLRLRSIPGDKVHAVCKMHQIKCAGILGWKTVCATDFETQPRFRLILFISLHWSFQCNCYFIFFADRNDAGCSKNVFYESLKEARRRRHFWVFGSSPKKYWFHQSESHLRIDTDLCFLHVFTFLCLTCLFFVLIFCVVIFFYFVYCFLFVNNVFTSCL